MRIRTRSDRGETLLEMVISIAILGVCVTGIGAGMAVSAKTSSIQSAQASAGAALHNYAESLQSAYTTCSGATPPNYVTAGGLVAPSSNFTAPTASVKFWNPATKAFDSASCPATDPGLQQVTLGLTTTDGLVSESLTVVLRRSS